MIEHRVRSSENIDVAFPSQSVYVHTSAQSIVNFVAKVLVAGVESALNVAGRFDDYFDAAISSEEVVESVIIVSVFTRQWQGGDQRGTSVVDCHKTSPDHADETQSQDNIWTVAQVRPGSNQPRRQEVWSHS